MILKNYIRKQRNFWDSILGRDKMTNLRFIKRGDEKILQKLILISVDQEPFYGRLHNRKYKWIDVPLVKEVEYENTPDPLTGGV